MKHITILVPEGENNLSSIIGSYKILNRANDWFLEKNGERKFQIDLAGIASSNSFYNGLFTIHPNQTIESITKTDLIIIPSLNHNYEHAISVNQQIIEWVKMQYKNGAELASICTGAFLLAETGLLQGRRCSTHWSAANDFRRLYPGVKLQADQLITHEHGIYTNGGAFSFLNLMIYLVERYFDRETAIYCAKVFQIEMERNSQSSFAIFSGQKNHGDEVVEEAQEYLEECFQDKVSISDLADKLAVSRRNFDRRFIKATGNTPLEYLRRLKIEAAKRDMESTRKNINEIMFDVGYADSKAFRDTFRKYTGLSPLEYKNRYNRELAMA